MKSPKATRFLTAAAMAVALVTLGHTAQAQENYVVDQFETEDSVSRWSRWWGSAVQLYEFDPSVDVANDSNSGSLKATIDFDVATYGGDNQFALQGGFPENATLDGTAYTNLVFNVRWAAASPKNSGGDYGNLEYGLRNADFTQTTLGSRVITSDDADKWVRIEAAIDPATPKLDTITGVWLKIWSGSEGGLTGQTVFWLDDVQLLANTNAAPFIPSLQILPATSGLRLVASAADQFQRQNIRTQAADAEANPNSYSWVGSTTPVTYSLTLENYPDAAHSGFQTHLFLVPEAGMPFGPGDTSIDWNAPNVVFVQIANNDDGTGTARFMYKTNLPSGNSMFWNTDPSAGPVGTLASISDASPVGTWNITLNNNTDVTVTSPSGVSTNFALPAEAAELFADPIYTYVGVQPNNLQNIGQSVTLSSFKITGAATPLEDSFSAEALDPARWAVVAPDATGIVVVPPTARYWLVWDAPSTGFVVQSSPTLVPVAWADPGVNENIVQLGTKKSVILPETALPTGSAAFFRLVKP